MDSLTKKVLSIHAFKRGSLLNGKDKFATAPMATPTTAEHCSVKTCIDSWYEEWIVRRIAKRAWNNGNPRIPEKTLQRCSERYAKYWAEWSMWSGILQEVVILLV